MKNVILTIAVLLSFNQLIFAQILEDISCYTVSTQGASSNVLFKYDALSNTWSEVGSTGRTNIETIATNISGNIIYAVDGGQFGQLNLNTGAFLPIGNSVGTANGSLGSVTLNDIDGLTYDYINNSMFATHRITGTVAGTNDLLFHIDVETGSFVPEAMVDPATGNKVDYVMVQDSFIDFDGNIVNEFDIHDIAYNSNNGELLAIQGSPGYITHLNLRTGEIEKFAFNTGIENLEGLAFTSNDQLFASTGDNASSVQDSNAFIFINLDSKSTITLNKIDPTGVNKGFKSLACFDMAEIPSISPTTIQITNANQTGPEIIQGDSIIVPIEFDLTLDSLGQAMSADGLCFTLHSPKSYQDFEMETVYEPLILNELEINNAPSEFTVCINRNNNEVNKRNAQKKITPDLEADEAIVQLGVCIVVDDVPGKFIDIDSLYISGYRNMSADQIIRLQSTNLLIGFDVEKGENRDNRLELALKLNHKDCENSGSIEIDIENNRVLGIPDFTYSLTSIIGNQYNEIIITKDTSYIFDNLEVGEYELKVSDNSIIKVRKKFSVGFVANINGSICCTENLIVPPGSPVGEFLASDNVSVSMGAVITKGTINSTCD